MMHEKSNDSKKLNPSEEQKRIESLQEKYLEERKAFDKDYNTYVDTVLDFQKKLSVFLKNANKTAEQLAKDVGIAPETLSRYRNGKAPSLQTLMAMCVVLNLDIKQSQELFNALGYSFLGTSREHYAYIYLIENHRDKELWECNDILTGLGIDIDFLLYPDRHKRKIEIKDNLKKLAQLQESKEVE